MTEHEMEWSEHPARAVWARGRDGSNAAAPDVAFEDRLDAYGISGSLWSREVISRGMQRVRSANWRTSVHDVPDRDLEFLGRHAGSIEALYVGDEASYVAWLHIGEGHASFRVAARTDEAVDERVAYFQAQLPAAEPDPEDPRVPVTFWSLGLMGPSSRTRMIAVPQWPAISENYTLDVAGELGRLMGPGFVPGAGGQLLLWHGPPGTGKTWALRALAWEWREWADLHYITDPETFFGDHANYMLDVLLEGEGDLAQPALVTSASNGDPIAAKAMEVASRWKLLVLEDTGELMSADARERSGQGLSRLLNVVDGLIGQGLRVLVLVTTNEELRTLHDAIRRPGRCASQLLFQPFDEAEAAAWLAARGVEYDGTGRTVADMFAILDERQADRGRAPVGFGS